jgi:hypothetical protein
MNSTLSDWNTKLRHSFDHLHPSVISSFTDTHTDDILVVIGLITVCLILFLLIIQFFIKIRDIYRTSEPMERCKKSSKSQSKYPSYQKLLDTNNNQCKCFQYSCLPKFQCIKPNCQILNRSSYYQQINERQINNSIHQVYNPRHISCIRIHIVK